jgi:asparagine synthase (glutamine-hydrolysing)
MCGVAGVIRLDGAPAAPATLQAMTDAIAHRGPDGQGHWIEGNLALGHRRLAIIDLSPQAAQPMLSADGRYVLSYNGELYNFRELRKELEAEGCVFRSQTDSEVVLYALAQWGTRALRCFNGMFALAFWDRRKRQLVLARDRYGVKPLYYYTQGNWFAFASEQKAILALPEVTRRIDAEALLEYFTFQNIFTDKTLLQSMRILLPGHYARLDLRDTHPTLRLQRYWDFHFREPEAPARAAEYREELDRLFRQAVTRQMVADVELGSYLSGGIDSGAISAIAAAAHPYLKSFTCGFDLSSASGIELAFDERQKAEAMSAQFKTEHYEIVLKAGDMERAMPTLVLHLEEPRVGQSYPNFYAAKLASRFVKVVLSGSGGDELFAGYPWRYYRAAVSDNFEHYIDQYYLFWQRLIPNTVIKKLFAPISGETGHIHTRSIFRDVFASHSNTLKTPEDYINHSLYFEAKTFLHGLLVMEDKLSMAHGLESRVPFLDNDLVDFAMTCPVGLKLNNLQTVLRMNENEPGHKTGKYFAKTQDGKQILREVTGRYIPSDIAGGAKQGFSAPDASWFKGESMAYVRRQLLTGQPRIYEYLNRNTAQALVEEHLDGRENRRLFIWSLLSMEQFLNVFMA